MNDYQFYKSIGICPTCRKNPLPPGRCRCAECQAKARQQQKQYRAKVRAKMDADPDYEKQLRGRQQEASRRYQLDHIKRGLCMYCPRPAVPGTQLCQKHLEDARQRDRIRYDKRRKHREHLELPDHKYAQKDIGKLFALYNAGWSIHEIAREIKSTESTVYRWLRIAREEATNADIS